MSKKRYEIGSRNVFKDIGVPNAEEHLVKAQLVFKIDTIMKKRRLKQVEAAELFGVRQPDVSKMLSGEFRQFSVERLLRFLVALDQDVEIVVKAAPRQEKRSCLAGLLKPYGIEGVAVVRRTTNDQRPRLSLREVLLSQPELQVALYLPDSCQEANSGVAHFVDPGNFSLQLQLNLALAEAES